MTARRARSGRSGSVPSFSSSTIERRAISSATAGSSVSPTDPGSGGQAECRRARRRDISVGLLEKPEAELHAQDALDGDASTSARSHAAVLDGRAQRRTEGGRVAGARMSSPASRAMAAATERSVGQRCRVTSCSTPM